MIPRNARPSVMAASLFCAALCALLLPPASFADTYQATSLGSDAARFLYGIDDAGTVVLNTSSYCNLTCYTTYTNGVDTANTTNPPNLLYDDGSACAPTETGYVVEHAVCNGGRTAWTGYANGDPRGVGVFLDVGSTSTLVAMGGSGPLMLNASGDVVWDDELAENFYEAFAPASTPEPNSLALLVTGVFAAGAETWRRGRRRAF